MSGISAGAKPPRRISFAGHDEVAYVPEEGALERAPKANGSADALFSAASPNKYSQPIKGCGPSGNQKTTLPDLTPPKRS